ncbi:MAG: hypothetical protein WBD31_25005 [Rubripirellula sp.]
MPNRRGDSLQLVDAVERERRMRFGDQEKPVATPCDIADDGADFVSFDLDVAGQEGQGVKGSGAA